MLCYVFLLQKKTMQKPQFLQTPKRRLRKPHSLIFKFSDFNIYFIKNDRTTESNITF